MYNGLLSQPNKCSLYYAIRVLKIATDRDLLHTISIVFTEYGGLYNDLCCIHYSPLCIAGQLSCILRLECKHYNYRNTYKIYASHLSHGSSSF